MLCKLSFVKNATNEFTSAFCSKFLLFVYILFRYFIIVLIKNKQY